MIASTAHLDAHTVMIPGGMVPSFRVKMAFEKGAQHKFLINTWGGLGDQICAEPSIRWALKMFPQCEITLASECPELFSHLKFHEVIDTRKYLPKWENYLVFNTITPPSNFMWEFFSHMLTHCVDFPSLCMWRCQLPIEDKEIKLPRFDLSMDAFRALKEDEKNTIVIHAGKHWPSKTFPKAWWDELLSWFIQYGFKVVLIGKKVDENVGYVDVNSTGCTDLRDKLKLHEFISVLTNCRYLFSNDSSPIHAAAAGDAFIGFVASCKHPDYITHYRKGVFGYKTKNFGLDGSWNHIDQSPSQSKSVTVEDLPEGLMEKILPRPLDVVTHYHDLRLQGG